MSRVVKTVLVDGDEVMYRLGFAGQTGGELKPKKSIIAAIKRVNASLNRHFPTASVVYFLGGKGNFRNERATLLPYKGNRDNAIRPFYLGFIRQYIEENFFTVSEDGYESDDAMAIRHWASCIDGSLSTVLCCQDKDLNQIPGWRYDIWKKQERLISGQEARRFVFQQWLTGDKQVDNIPGVCGIGKIKAGKLLEGFTNKQEMANIVARAYVNEFQTRPQRSHLIDKGLSPLECMQEVGALIWMLRYPEQDFDLDVWPDIRDLIDQEVKDDDRNFNSST